MKEEKRNEAASIRSEEKYHNFFTFLFVFFLLSDLDSAFCKNSNQPAPGLAGVG